MDVGIVNSKMVKPSPFLPPLLHPLVIRYPTMPHEQQFCKPDIHQCHVGSNTLNGLTQLTSKAA